MTPCPRCGVRLGDEHGTLGRADLHEVPCDRHPGGRECPTMPCEVCQAGVGKGAGRTVYPVRTPNRLARARRRAHAAFDRLWKKTNENRRPFMSRTGAYRWLQRWTGLGEEEAHISRMDAEACERVEERAVGLLRTLGDDGG